MIDASSTPQSLNTAEAVAWLRTHGMRMTEMAFVQRRQRGTGPACTKIGRRYYHQVADLQRWLSEITDLTPASEPQARLHELVATLEMVRPASEG